MTQRQKRKTDPPVSSGSSSYDNKIRQGGNIVIQGEQKAVQGLIGAVFPKTSKGHKEKEQVQSSTPAAVAVAVSSTSSQMTEATAAVSEEEEPADIAAT